MSLPGVVRWSPRPRGAVGAFVRGKMKVAAVMAGFCHVMALNKMGEKQEGWMEQSRLRSSIPPMHGSSREQAFLHES